MSDSIMDLIAAELAAQQRPKEPPKERTFEEIRQESEAAPLKAKDGRPIDSDFLAQAAGDSALFKENRELILRQRELNRQAATIAEEQRRANEAREQYRLRQDRRRQRAEDEMQRRQAEDATRREADHRRRWGVE